MHTSYLKELAAYIIWADNKAITWLSNISDEQWDQETASSFSSIKATAIHIVSAQKIWLDFWKKMPDPVYLSTGFKGTRAELIAIWKQAAADLKTFIETYPEENYEEVVNVKKPNGEISQMEFWRTLQHMVNHSTYHRGQLVTLLRHAGFTGFSNTDLFTYYLRQNQDVSPDA